MQDAYMWMHGACKYLFNWLHSRLSFAVCVLQISTNDLLVLTDFLHPPWKAGQYMATINLNKSQNLSTTKVVFLDAVSLPYDYSWSFEQQ